MEVPIKVSHLFRPLDRELIKMLGALEPADWDRKTPARLWTVKDVASHLLDGNLRTLSIQRDKYFGEMPPSSPGYDDLVRWLNQLNDDWVKATKRLSPAVLIALHQATGEATSAYYESLNPWEEAIFAVDWAGESISYNWMHLAREYTEKWHHQQQIREATGHAGLMDREYFFPVMDTFFMALPHTFRAVDAKPGAVVKTMIPGDAGGSWLLKKAPQKWELVTETDREASREPDAMVEIEPEVAWKLFCKNIRPEEIKAGIRVTGDLALGRQVLQLVAVMA